jgi:hypothetical protein
MNFRKTQRRLGIWLLAVAALLSYRPLADAAETPCASPSDVSALPTPMFSLNFDSESEWADSGASYKGNLLYVPGRAGNAVRMTSGYISLPAARVLRLDSGSISMWVASESFYGAGTSQFRLIDSDNNAGWSFRLLRAANKQLQFFVTDGTNDANPNFNSVMSASPNLYADLGSWTAGEWHHIALTWGPESVRLYIDGRLNAQAPRTVFFPTPEKMPGNLYLLGSNRAGNTASANGAFRLDLFSSYAQELTPAQIGALFSGTLDRAGVSVTAGRLVITLLGAKDGFGLDSICDSASATRKTMNTPSRKLWQVTLRQAGGTAQFTVANTASLSGETAWSYDGATHDTVLRWTGIALPDPNFSQSTSDTMDVTVRIAAEPADNTALARISVALHGAAWSLSETVFPRLGGLGPVGANPDDTMLLVPDYTLGRGIPNPFVATLPIGNSYPSRHMTMQWFGLTDTATQQGGIYIGMHDPTSMLKAFRFSRPIADKLASTVSDPGLDVDVAVYAENIGAAENGFTMSWPAVIALQDGSWYDMARRYRAFAVTQRWTGAGPLSARGDVPKWLSDAGLINQGASPGISLSLTGKLASQGAASGTTMWHYIQWDRSNTMAKQSLINDSPTLAPSEAFASSIGSAQAAKMPVAIYFNPTLWDTLYDFDGPNPWETEDGQSMAIRNANGSIVMYGSTAYEKPPARVPGVPWINAARMCPAAAGWQQKVQSTLSSLASLPVSGVYLDEITAYAPSLCFAQGHGHLPGGGSYWVDGYRALLGKSRELARQANPSFGFYSESFSEPYLDLIDGYLVADSGVANALPLSTAVYHDFAQFIGRYLSAGDSFETMVAKEAQSFSWGIMPGWTTFPLDSTKYTDIRNYLLSLAQFRQKFQDYLVFGDMMAPPDCRLLDEAPTGQSGSLIPAHNATPMATRSLQGYTETNALQTFTAPAVFSSAWRSRSGNVAILLVSSEAQDPGMRIVYVPLSVEQLGFKSGSASITLREGSSRRSLGTISGPGAARVEVPAGGVVLLELAEAPRRKREYGAAPDSTRSSQ